MFWRTQALIVALALKDGLHVAIAEIGNRMAAAVVEADADRHGAVERRPSQSLPVGCGNCRGQQDVAHVLRVAGVGAARVTLRAEQCHERIVLLCW